MKTNLIGISGKINSGKDTVGKIFQIIDTSPHFTDEAVVEFLSRDLYPSKYTIKKFADKLKDIVCLLIGCTREQLEDREYKEKELGEEWRVWSVWVSFDEDTKIFGSKKEAEQFHEEVWDNTGTHIKSYVLTPRLLTQLLGTECGRNIIHPNIWVNALFSGYVQKEVIEPISEENRVKYKMGFTPRDQVSLKYPNWIITDVRFPDELKAVESRKGLSIRVEREVSNTLGAGHISETALDGATFDYVIYNDGTLVDLIKKVRNIIKEES